MKLQRLVMTLSSEELADLDAYCVQQRRETGQQVFRTEIIREAVLRLVQAAKWTAGATTAPVTRRDGDGA